MVSIPHYEDLSAQEIYDSLELNWWASEKLDGSYLLFGLDDAGEFYTQRKGAQPCYKQSDYPEECWASSYRICHELAQMVIDALVHEKLIAPGQSIGAEIIDSPLPNTVPYRFSGDFSGLLVVTTISWDADPAFFDVLKDFQSTWYPNKLFSNDGINMSQMVHKQVWQVKVNHQIPRDLTYARLHRHAIKFRRVLDHWFPQESKVEGFTILDVLDISLSRKPEQAGDRNWTELRKELSLERAELREVFRDLVMLFKDIAHRVLVSEMPSCIGAGSFKEGVVVKTPTGIFKIVDRDSFSEANRFTHIIKYWIVGGRRPNRPSFLSRTKDWPKEKRLERLEALRVRFMNNHFTMHHRLAVGPYEEMITYSGTLFRRTLGMFCDTRKRIEDGR